MLINLGSCSYVGVPSDIKNNFKPCFNQNKSDIHSKINTQGYYVVKEPLQKSLSDNGKALKNNQGEVSDTSHYCTLFFEDGTFLANFFDINEDRCKKGMSDIPQLFQEIAQDSKGKTAKSFYSWFRWGKYSISGDTIKAKWTNHPLSISPNWSAWEVWYKIIDKNTLVEISSTPLHHMTDSDWKNFEIYSKRDTIPKIPARFVPASVVPEPNSWLKQKKWYWCNPSDWKNYRKARKKN
ncbi:MAG: hypothetical protein CVU05_02955 [Bacteroidetes bacterium HGW-Bacteroidetes-21]|nr:MAG: hypothetical protein CVU05_02955 [Bacteroidetes bacterium HGW-Bacteroidetes-21]